MTRARFLVLSAVPSFAAALLGAPPARAQQGPIVVTPGGGMPDVSDQVEADQSPKTGRGSYKLFDQRNTVRSYTLHVGPLWSRQATEQSPYQARSGFERGAPLAAEISLGMEFKTPYRPFFLMGTQKTLFRIVDDKSFSWSIFHQEVGAGVILGPFEPSARVGLSVLTADIFHAEPSLQLLSPRVGAGVGVHLGRLTVDVQVHSEYLWRWFGPDYLLRGISIGLGFDAVRPKPPLPESSP